MKRTCLLVCALICGISLWAQTISPQDLAVAQKIKTEALRNTKVPELMYKIVDQTGPRLAGSDGMEKGMTIAREILAGIPLSDSRIEFGSEFPMGGWDNTKAYLAMTAPFHVAIFTAPVPWTGSANIEEEVILIEATNTDDLKKYKGKLKNRIVLMPSTQSYEISFAPLATRHSEETLKNVATYPVPKYTPASKTTPQPSFNTQLLEFVRAESPALIIHEDGNFNNPRIRFNKAHQKGTQPSPCEVNITLEIHGLMERLILNGEKVRIAADIRNKFTPQRNVSNVIAEIKGTDPTLKEQIVLIGAHLDAYSIGGGAGDDAAGCIAMIEAMRILKTIGVQPRRTIRIALWGGEEIGLYGSRGYVKQHVLDPETGKKGKEHDKISAYFNSDYGPGRFRGIYTQDNLMVHPIFSTWKTPFEDMEFTTVSNKSVGSTDHIPFDGAGIPAFQFIQDNLEWGRASHLSTDYADRLVVSDLQHNAIIIAWFAYMAAQADEMMPRK